MLDLAYASMGLMGSPSPKVVQVLLLGLIVANSGEPITDRLLLWCLPGGPAPGPKSATLPSAPVFTLRGTCLLPAVYVFLMHVLYALLFNSMRRVEGMKGARAGRTPPFVTKIISAAGE